MVPAERPDYREHRRRYVDRHAYGHAGVRYRWERGKRGERYGRYQSSEPMVTHTDPLWRRCLNGC